MGPGSGSTATWESWCATPMIRGVVPHAVAGRGSAASHGEIMGQLGLKLHSEKTRIVELGLGKEGFVFLGCHLRIVRSHFVGRTYLFGGRLRER